MNCLWKKSLPVILITLLVFISFPIMAQDEESTLEKEIHNRTDTDPMLYDKGEEIDIKGMLSDGLTRKEAVQIALVNNPQLKSAFRDIGIAETELEKAGYYTNPELEVIWHKPDRGNSLEVHPEFNIADFWIVPVREDLAKEELEIATWEVLNYYLNIVTDTKLAYNDCVLHKEVYKETGEILSSVKKLKEEMYVRYDFGFSNELDLAMIDSSVAEWEMELEMAGKHLEIAKSRLKRLITIGLDVDVEISEEIQSAPQDFPFGEGLVKYAFENRPDMEAAKLNISAFEKNYALQRRSVWKQVVIGPSYKLEADGESGFGVYALVELPVFNTNEAGINKAEYLMQQARYDRDALEGMIMEEVTVLQEKLSLALYNEKLLREHVIPLKEKAYDYASKYYNQMQLNGIYLFEAQKELNETKKAHIETLGEVNRLLVEIEFLLGGKMP